MEREVTSVMARLPSSKSALLQHLQRFSQERNPETRKALLQIEKKALMRWFAMGAKNLLNGNVYLTKPTKRFVQKHLGDIRKLKDPAVQDRTKMNIILKRGGQGFLGAVIIRALLRRQEREPVKQAYHTFNVKHRAPAPLTPPKKKKKKRTPPVSPIPSPLVSPIASPIASPVTPVEAAAPHPLMAKLMPLTIADLKKRATSTPKKTSKKRATPKKKATPKKTPTPKRAKSKPAAASVPFTPVSQRTRLKRVGKVSSAANQAFTALFNGLGLNPINQ